MSRDTQAEHEKRLQTGDQILKLIETNIQSPSEAMILLQQLTLFIWNQYSIDWQSTPDFPVAESRKQRFLDFVSELMDNTQTEEPQGEDPVK